MSNSSPQVIWDSKDVQWDKPSEASAVASRPGQRATFDIPKSPMEMVGAGVGDEAAGNARMAEEHPGALASAALAGVSPVLPTTGALGLAANVAGRGMGALGGAAYGGRLASEAGLPRPVGQVVGGATGLFAPEVINKMGGPIIGRIAAMLGKGAPAAEEATGAAAETLPDVIHAPIKSGPFPNTPAGNIQNVPRALLPGIAERTGDPAAVAEISRVTGKPGLFVGEDYPAPRSVQSFGSEPPAPPRSTPFSGLPKPTAGPDIDALADKLVTQGTPRAQAQADAEGLVRRLTEPNWSRIQREVAQQSYDRIMGGGTRVGQNANYYGLERRGQ